VAVADATGDPRPAGDRDDFARDSNLATSEYIVLMHLSEDLVLGGLGFPGVEHEHEPCPVSGKSALSHLNRPTRARVSIKAARCG
jgi:hypothetical protein